jgi:Spy/CpxP family protein refolding chaperone
MARRLLAATALLAIVASLAQPAFAMPGADMGDHAGGPMGAMAGMAGGAGMMAGRQGERLLDSIGASAEQKTQLRQIMDAARADIKPLREAARALHRQMQALFTQPTVDAGAVDAMRAQLVANHDQVSKRMTQAMLDASRVLSPEQRKQMADRREQRRAMMQRHRAERESLDGGAAASRRP